MFCTWPSELLLFLLKNITDLTLVYIVTVSMETVSSKMNKKQHLPRGFASQVPVYIFVVGDAVFHVILSSYYHFIAKTPSLILYLFRLFYNPLWSILYLCCCCFQANGVNGLFKGIVPRTLRRTLMAALSWTVYEQV